MPVPRRRRGIVRSGGEVGEIAGAGACREDRRLSEVLAVLGVFGGEAVELGDGLDVGVDLAMEQDCGGSVSGSQRRRGHWRSDWPRKA